MRKGSKHSPETVIKMSLAKLGKPSPKKGCTLSEETKQKIRESVTPIARKLSKSKSWRKKVSDGTKEAYKNPIVKQRASMAIKLRNSLDPNWKGGFTYKANGYKLIWKPEHPNSGKHGYIMEHRLVMSEHIGRPLDKEEVVHHIDHDITNNHISNLQLFESKSAHRIHHTKHQP